MKPCLLSSLKKQHRQTSVVFMPISLESNIQLGFNYADFYKCMIAGAL